MEFMLRTAAAMLNCEQSQLHPDFVKYLGEIQSLVFQVEGRITSRQIVAPAIVNWQHLTGEKAKVI